MTTKPDPTTYYKVLNPDGTPCNGGSGQWFLPKGSRPGKWMPEILNPKPCVRGYHLCREEDLMTWLGPAIFMAQGKGRSVTDTDKVVFQQARLLSRLDTWNNRTARLFAADCAERVCENNKPSLALLDKVRLFARQEITREELDAARDTAWYTARDTARYAARDTARDAARDAAWYAARDAARDAAWYAARDAAWYAARDAAWYTARDAARYAERQWQTQQLFHYLDGEPT